MAGITENLLEQTALENINPNIPPDAISEAIREITRRCSVRSGCQHDEKDVMMLAPSSELTN